jgi:arsenite methyltransferase
MTSYDLDNARLAQDYDRLSDQQLQSGKALLERMGLASGSRVLDVGCGTGRLAEWIAGRVGAEGRVVGIDPLAERIAIAREKVLGARFEVGQAEDLSAFPDGGFDLVCMSAVFHWITDKPKALAEIARVLAPGGSVGLTTSPRELHDAAGIAKVFMTVFSQAPFRGHVRKENFAFSQQSSTATDLITMLLGSGLSLRELHVVERVSYKQTADDLLDFIESSTFGNFLSAIPAQHHEAFRVAFGRAIETCREPEGLAVRDYGMSAVARKLGG